MFELSSLQDIELLSESAQIECKLAKGRDGKGEVPKDMWESYSAFANSDGGYIILGLREKKSRFTIEGLENTHKLKGDILNTVNNASKVSFNLLNNQSLNEIEIDGKKILIIYVRRANRNEKPVYLNGNPFGHTFRRMHEADQRLNDEQIRRLLAEQIEESRDKKVLKNFRFEELDSESLKEYRQTYTNLNPSAPWNDVDDITFLQRIGG